MIIIKIYVLVRVKIVRHDVFTNYQLPMTKQNCKKIKNEPEIQKHLRKSHQKLCKIFKLNVRILHFSMIYFTNLLIFS